jgi:hypothetical protein
VHEAVDHPSLPILSNYGPDGKAVAGEALDLVRKRLTDFA